MNRSSGPVSVRSLTVVAAVVFALAAGPAVAQQKPQYGGTLNVGAFVTLSPMSWDVADWAWKFTNDTGLAYEQLFVGDLSKAASRGGKHRFTISDWLPGDAIRGELAESWQWHDNPMRVEIKLRKGVMFPDKPGVMKSRELVADDVVHTYTRLANSAKKQPQILDHIDRAEAKDRHTVVFHFKNYSAEWDRFFGWGYYAGITPKEVTDAGPAQWKNVNGTGPFVLEDVVQGHAVTWARNPVYWDKETIGGQAYKLPFLDKIVYRTIKDESAFLTALRTGKLDLLESIRWSAVDELKKSAPALKWKKRIAGGGIVISLRVDAKPFDDVRVRRALNVAIDKQEIVKSYYGGNAELFGYPMHPDYTGYYESLDQMPAAVQELFTYNPEKARALLAEAGYPKGFGFKVQVCTCSTENMDLLPVVAAYLEKVGVKVEIQPLEQGALWSALTTKTNAAGFMHTPSHGSPPISIRKSFVTKQTYNPSQYSDPEMDKRVDATYLERDESRRQLLVKLMTRDIVEKAPNIWLPTPHLYTAWWPWVKNYDGELSVGAFRNGPIHARIWIDQEMKKKMGF
jgi:peptide/nickel transport system substrate-binding protein